jgi:hypothetical protein
VRSKVLEKQVSSVQALAEQVAQSADSEPPVLHPAPPRQLVRQTGRFELLPRSFQDFLRSHNGWERFWRGFTLRGITGNHTARAVAAINATVAEELAALEGPKNRRRWDEGYLHLPDHPIFGTDFNGQLLLFDIRRTDKRRENPVVLWRNDTGVVQTFTNFSLLLRRVVADHRRELPLGEGSPEPHLDRRRRILAALRRVRARRLGQDT